MQLDCLERLEGCRFTGLATFCPYIRSEHYLPLKHYQFFCGPARVFLEPCLIDGIASGVSKFVGLGGFAFIGEELNQLIQLPMDTEGLFFKYCLFLKRRPMDMIPFLQGLAEEVREIEVEFCYD